MPNKNKTQNIPEQENTTHQVINWCFFLNIFYQYWARLCISVKMKTITTACSKYTAMWSAHWVQGMLTVSCWKHCH
jgi:hypothetical protein